MVKNRKRIAAAGLLFVVFTLVLLYAAIQSIWAHENHVKKISLYATDGYVTMPDGNQMYIWGYSSQNKKGTAVYPAPTMEVEEGDQVEITLTNLGPSKSGILPVSHTIHFHGLDTDQKNDGVPHTAPPVFVGESFTYQFNAKHAGTYFYHCHVDTVEHLQMGMTGAFIVKAHGGVKQAWTGGPSYDKEAVFHLNEIDRSWHDAVEQRKTYDRTVFEPDFWTMNGEFKSRNASSSIVAQAGETYLIRLINSGYEKHTFHMNGRTFKVIASDGRPLRQAVDKQSITMASAERYDILVKFDQAGTYAVEVDGQAK
ncbi:multicopper oxidase family protein [Paenibacillus planticolens]|uniref:Multicopper oxidase domain-containing protein n=1 Tax=Paenibacillus planticolens TaxID=2654976 RepID=A0ABX1ZK72_9BACL|nr:multicopper oxidase family protein [Paenibacillus planticolens]NOV00058.1 multicopper oxidase domain-containing protein [Paenibacillus planticolens]